MASATMINHNEICNKILSINHLIRYAGVYYEDVFHFKTREGLRTFLTESESKRSVMEAIRRWENDQFLYSKLGNLVYSSEKFEKVYRLSFPVGREGLILVSTEIGLDPTLIWDEIVEIKQRYFS